MVKLRQQGRRLWSGCWQIWVSICPLGYCPSCLPPSPEWSPLLHGSSPSFFPTSWLTDRLPTSYPLRCESPLQWKVCFVLSYSKPVKDNRRWGAGILSWEGKGGNVCQSAKWIILSRVFGLYPVPWTLLLTWCQSSRNEWSTCYRGPGRVCPRIWSAIRAFNESQSGERLTLLDRWLSWHSDPESHISPWAMLLAQGCSMLMCPWPLEMA